jgi:hypothetical protein
LRKKPAAASQFRAAVREGVVPRARRPFVLFFQELASTAEFRHIEAKHKMKLIAERWKHADASTKARLKELSDAEFQVQRLKCATAGIKRRQTTGARSQEAVEPAAASPSCSGTPATATLFGNLEVDNAPPLGQGSFGRVLLTTDRETGRKLVVKTMLQAEAGCPGTWPREQCCIVVIVLSSK